MAIPFLSDAKFLRLHKLKFHNTGEITTNGGTGTLFDISAIGNNTDLRFLADNGDGDNTNAVYFLLDGSMAVTGAPDLYTRFPDNSHLVFGNATNSSSLDLEIYHVSDVSYIKGNHPIYIDSNSNIDINGDGGVDLRHNNSKKFETTTTGVDVTGTINLDNLTINGAQGTDGQVLTSTGSGIAWENASGGTSLSGGEASKVAVWSATDTLTHHANFHFDTTNVRLGIGTPSPSSMLHLKSTGDVTLTLEADSNNVGENDNPLIELKQDGGGIISRFGNVGDAGQIFTNSRSNSTGLGSVYQQDLIFFTENSARIYVKGENGYQGRVGIGAATPSQTLDVNGNVTADRYFGNGATNYYLDPNHSTTSAVLSGAVSIGSSATYTKLSVSTPAGYGAGADGIFIRSSFAGSVPVTGDKDPFLSIGCSDDSGSVSTIFMGEDATATSQESKIEYSHDNATLGIFVIGQGSYREHVRFGEQSSSQARTRFYGNVGIGTNPSRPLHVAGDIETTTGSVKIADNWGQGFYSREQLSIVGEYPSLALRNTAGDNKWLIHHDGNDLTFYAGSDFDSNSWTKKVQVDSGSQGVGAQRFYDIDSTSYYIEPGSAGAALTTNGYLYQAKEDYNIDASTANAIYQATRSTQTDRGTWPTSYMFAVNFGDRTKGIQLASRYGGSNELYFRSGTDNSSSENGANTWKNWRQLYHVDYHPEADKWTTARTITLAGDLSGSVSIDGSANVTLTATVNDDSHDLTWANIDGETANSVNSWGGLRHQTNDGYIDFGPANTSHAHIYTDRPNFYFNKELLVNNQQVFHTGYHPNADTWTTARTITIGSTGKSVNGSGNVSWSLSEIGAAAAGDENIIDGALSIWNADGDGDVFTYNDSNPVHNGKTLGAVINIKGDGAENGSLVRAGVYTGDHISVSRGYYVGTELNTTTANTTQVINSSGYWSSYPVFPYDSFSKTDISTRTGTGFYQDSSPTSGEGWPALGGNTSWAHLISSTHSNDSNYYAMQLSASFYNQNLYYRSTAGSGTTGWSKMWSDQNDGAGSGLDADLLDGQQGSYYAAASSLGNYLPLSGGTLSGDLTVNGGHFYGRSVNGQYSNIYRMGGIYFTWDSDSYGTNTHHSIRSTYGDSYGDDMTINSYHHLRINIDSNNNNTDEKFEIGNNTTGTGNVIFRVLGTGDVYAASDVIAYYSFSDKRLKTDIKPTTDNLDKILKLEPVEYSWKDGSRDGKKEIGLIAQDVEKVVPEVVRENTRLSDDDDTLYKQVDYEHLVSTLIGAVQEQQKQIDELKSIINGGS